MRVGEVAFAGRAARCRLGLGAMWTDAQHYFAVQYLSVAWVCEVELMSNRLEQNKRLCWRSTT